MTFTNEDKDFFAGEFRERMDEQDFQQIVEQGEYTFYVGTNTIEVIDGVERKVERMYAISMKEVDCCWDMTADEIKEKFTPDLRGQVFQAIGETEE